MTSKLNRHAINEQGLEMFPAFPPRDDMQNPLYLYVPGYLTTLSRQLGSPDTTLVLSEVPVGYRPGQRRGILIPDLIVAFNVNVGQVVGQWAKFEDHPDILDSRGNPQIS